MLRGNERFAIGLRGDVKDALWPQMDAEFRMVRRIFVRLKYLSQNQNKERQQFFLGTKRSQEGGILIGESMSSICKKGQVNSN